MSVLLILIKMRESKRRALIIALVSSERKLTGMKTLMRSEAATVCTSLRALVAGEWMLAGMHTLMRSELTVVCTSKLAFVACE